MIIDRRGLVLTGTAGLLLGLPGEALAALTPQNTVVWFGKNLTDHTNLVNQWAAKGFRSISVSIYDNPQAPMFAAVMTLRSQIIATEQHDGLSQAQLTQLLKTAAAKGLGPYILSATGPVGAQAYTVVLTPTNAKPLAFLDLTAMEFAAYNDGAHALGKFLWSMDSFGDPANPHYAAIWGPNPAHFAWTCVGPDNDAVALQRLVAQTATWSRPYAVTTLGPGQSLTAYTDSAIGPVTAHFDMTGAQFQATFNSEAATGRMPFRVAAGGSGADARFAALFATREEITPFVAPVRSNGLVSDATIDAAVGAFMTAENLKGLSLAVCKGSRLVYARGYTNAEPDYPDVTPTTSFRQASVSKFFTAAAWWRLFQTRADINPQTKVQDILQLIPPPPLPGKMPFQIAPLFGQITLQNLLESCSGLNQNVFTTAPFAAGLYGSPPPGTTLELVRAIACLPMTGTPGDKSNVIYGNVDYQILGLALMTLLKAASVEDAIRQTLLTALHIGQSTRTSRTLLAEQPGGEARYHLRAFDHSPKDSTVDPLTVGPRYGLPGAHLVSDQYGAIAYETFVGCGGLSATAVDVARLAACLSCRTGNPLFTPDTITNWMTLAAIATKVSKNSSTTDGPHGYHGLDRAIVVDPVNKVYAGNKGGWLPGHQSIVSFETGGFAIVLLWNGNTPADPAAPAWGSGDYIKAIVQAVTAAGANLSTTDLFPKYEMPSFPPSLPGSIQPLGFLPIDANLLASEQRAAWTRARRAVQALHPRVGVR
jgi:CubicO group peptidase (beta-lactamase class C family)